MAHPPATRLAPLSPFPHSRFLRLAVAAAGGILAVAGCSGTQAAAPASADHGTLTPSSSAPAPSPKPSLPTAADGTNLQACSRGHCEVRVGPAARIPVPPSMLVASLRVRSVRAGKVTLLGRIIGNNSSGNCYVNCNESSSGNRFRLTLGVGATGTQNHLSITVRTISGQLAVLRITRV
jgi:hypothetical protein